MTTSYTVPAMRRTANMIEQGVVNRPPDRDETPPPTMAATATDLAAKERLDNVAHFPDEKSLHRLRGDGVRYIVVHLIEIEPSRREAVLDDLRYGFGLAELTRRSDGRGEAVVFALR